MSVSECGVVRDVMRLVFSVCMRGLCDVCGVWCMWCVCGVDVVCMVCIVCDVRCLLC